MNSPIEFELLIRQMVGVWNLDDTRWHLTKLFMLAFIT
jgi:hypothetical protein